MPAHIFYVELSHGNILHITIRYYTKLTHKAYIEIVPPNL